MSKEKQNNIKNNNEHDLLILRRKNIFLLILCCLPFIILIVYSIYNPVNLCIFDCPASSDNDFFLTVLTYAFLSSPLLIVSFIGIIVSIINLRNIKKAFIKISKKQPW